MTKMKEIKVGCWVAFNTLPDAVWFEVVAISGFILGVREAPGHFIQTIDKSLVQQVRY